MNTKKRLILIFLAILFATSLLQAAINSEKRVLKVRYLNQWPNIKDSKHMILYQALAEIGNVVITDGYDYDIIIDGVFGEEELPHTSGVKIFYTGESVPAKLQGYDLAIGFDEFSAANYMRIPVYYIERVNSKLDFAAYKNRGQCRPNKKYFACFLVSNAGEHKDFLGRNFEGCRLRNRMFHKLSLYKKVHSGGKYLNTEGKLIPRNKTQQWLSECKFVIAYENGISYPGYVTEKPFQAYYAGAIPIYHAHPSFVKDVNPAAVIYGGDFANEDAMVEYIKKVDQDDDLYCKIWSQNIMTSPEQNYERVKERLRKRVNELLEAKHG